MESCNSKNLHAANQVSSGYIIKETAKQSIAVALFNSMQPHEKTPSRKRSTSITSASGTSSSKKLKLSEEGNIQGGRLDVGNEVIDEIVCQKVDPWACPHPTAPPPHCPPPPCPTPSFTKFWVTESKNDLVIKKLNLIMKFLQTVKNLLSYFKCRNLKKSSELNFKIIDSCHKHC